jgi:xanthine dehydrogenase accessory factor
MAIAESGAYFGSFSGGCVEAAVVGEAQRAIASGEIEHIRFGAESPFIDIKLPCGGGMDLLILPQPSEKVIRQARDALAARQPIALRMMTHGSLAIGSGEDQKSSSWEGDAFVACHLPDLRIIALGHGSEVQALAALGRAYGIEVTVLTPDEAIVEKEWEASSAAYLLKTPGRSPHLITDRHTAVVFLFHDHDWETALLAQALEQEAFYIGAMGSRQTQARRVAALVEYGVSAERAACIVGPIGLIPATRDPDTLALSVLAQVVGLQQQRND